jgi:hypothetical protein
MVFRVFNLVYDILSAQTSLCTASSEIVPTAYDLKRLPAHLHVAAFSQLPGRHATLALVARFSPHSQLPGLTDISIQANRCSCSIAPPPPRPTALRHLPVHIRYYRLPGLRKGWGRVQSAQKTIRAYVDNQVIDGLLILLLLCLPRTQSPVHRPSELSRPVSEYCEQP